MIQHLNSVEVMKQSLCYKTTRSHTCTHTCAHMHTVSIIDRSNVSLAINELTVATVVLISFIN